MIFCTRLLNVQCSPQLNLPAYNQYAIVVSLKEIYIFIYYLFIYTPPHIPTHTHSYYHPPPFLSEVLRLMHHTASSISHTDWVKMFGSHGI